MESDALVLVVDEDEACRQLLTRTLATHGFTVLEAASGEEALELARGRHIAAAILEIPLAGLSGYEVCQQLKAEHGPDVAVIFLSGVRTEPYDRVAGLLVGGDDYLVKPSRPVSWRRASASSSGASSRGPPALSSPGASTRSSS